MTINQKHNVCEVPESLQQQWSARSYDGSVEHNSRAVINRYPGYWDGNPTTLIPLSPEDSAPLYVEIMGGAAPIIAKGRALYGEAKYGHAQEILNKLVYAEPQNQEAKDLLADVFEQIGYQQEGPSVRNSFLAAVYELRNGIPTGATPKSSEPDMIRAMTTELWLDFFGVRRDSDKVDALCRRAGYGLRNPKARHGASAPSDSTSAACGVINSPSARLISASCRSTWCST